MKRKKKERIQRSFIRKVIIDDNDDDVNFEDANSAINNIRIEAIIEDSDDDAFFGDTNSVINNTGL